MSEHRAVQLVQRDAVLRQYRRRASYLRRCSPRGHPLMVSRRSMIATGSRLTRKGCRMNHPIKKSRSALSDRPGLICAALPTCTKYPTHPYYRCRWMLTYFQTIQPRRGFLARRSADPSGRLAAHGSYFQTIQPRRGLIARRSADPSGRLAAHGSDAGSPCRDQPGCGTAGGRSSGAGSRGGRGALASQTGLLSARINRRSP